MAELGTVKNRDLEDMVYKTELTYDEIVDLLDIKILAQKAPNIPYRPDEMILVIL